MLCRDEKTLTGGTPENAEIQEDLNGKFSYTSPMPDYALGEEMGSLGGIIAIVFGTILAFLVVLGLAYGIKAAGKPAK